MTLNYHTYREIKQQPAVWQKAYELILSRKTEIVSFLDRYLKDGYDVVLTGAGTSAYIGDALESTLLHTRFRGARSIATTDILTSPELYFDGQSKILLISFARSGNSPESVGAIKAVEQVAGSVAHIFITCNPKGELALTRGEHVLALLLPEETNDVSLAMTSSYSTMLLACSLIANIDRIEDQRGYIKALAESVDSAMTRYESAIAAIAERDFHRAVFLGSGPLKGVAEESRLKLQELTDGSVMCAFDSFLGFRHGPKAVVKPDTLIVYLLSPNPKVQRYELDLVRQIKARNGVKGTVMVCRAEPEGDDLKADLCIEIGFPEDMPKYYGCVSYIFVAQLLGLFKSIQCGLSPDSPSVSGNISRVVEGVTLYI